MKYPRILALLAALALTMILGLLPVAAQSEAVPVTILPVTDAEFLPGAMFDLRIEVGADALPEDFAVSINGQNASDFLGAEPVVENWQVGADNPVTVTAVTWRGVSLPEPGDYTVTATASGADTTVSWVAHEPQAATAKNVILFIADGMTVAELTAARIAAFGVEGGKVNGEFAIDGFDELGLVHTNSVDTIMMDSANTASAMNTGHKGSVNATGVYADSSPDVLDDPRVETLAEILRRTTGKSIGVVTTSDFTDATPAAVWAHGRDRSSGSRASYALQALEGIQPDVLMGGGAQYLFPQTTEGSRRVDDHDLYAEYEAAGYTIVNNAAELSGATSGDLPAKLLGIFHRSDMNVWLDRNVYTDNLGDFTDQPGLVDMTLGALTVLNQNAEGFYLEVEAASVDKAMHPLDQERALSDLIEFNYAIAAAAEWAAQNAPDTLIVVTADHGHGYDVYGTVDVSQFNTATDDLGRRAAIRVYAAAGFPTYTDSDGDGYPEWDADITFAGTVTDHPDYTENFQVSPTYRVPAINQDGTYVDNPDDDPNGIVMSGNLAPSDSTGVHTLQDVPIFAEGPGAAFFGHMLEQSDIFFGMAYALGVDPRG